MVPQLDQQFCPLELHSPGAKREQRAAHRALTHWQRLRGDRKTPLFGDFRFAEDPAWGTTQFLLKQDSLVANSVFILCGDQVAESFGGRPIRKTLIEAAPAALREQMTADCEKAIEASGPAGSEGWYWGAEQRRVHYRYIFLPLEAPISRFGYIFGSYSSSTQSPCRLSGRAAGRKKRTPELRSAL